MFFCHVFYLHVYGNAILGGREKEAGGWMSLSLSGTGDGAREDERYMTSGRGEEDRYMTSGRGEEDR